MAIMTILNFSSVLQTIAILLAVAAFLPAQGAVLRQRRDSSRAECTTSKQSCQYYSHCINPKFPCGHNGFLLSYAEKRCELIDRLQLKNSRKCKSSSCVEFNSINWAHKTEDCLKSALENLNSEFEQRSVRSDPSTCLTWEQQAIQKMNKCYRMAWEEHPLSDEDASILTNLFRIDEYFDSIVDQGIPSIVMRQSNLTNTNALHSNRSYDRRLFCIKGAGNHPHGGDRDLTSEEVVAVVEKAMEGHNIPYPQYFYNGMDSLYEEEPCIKNEPSNVNIGLFDYHLVTLFVPPNTTVQQSTFQDVINTPTSRFAATLYQLSTEVANESAYSVLRFSQCGDGIRQAGEECDYGSVTEGCTTDCKIISGYDCTVDRMQPSICWPEVCGDGRRTRGEECDDSNTVSGDGCSNVCRLEKVTHSCTTAYNVSSTCQACPCTESEETQVQFAPKRSPAYITARRVSHSQSKVLAATKRTIQLPAGASSASSLSSTSLTISLILAAVVAIGINLDLWR